MFSTKPKPTASKSTITLLRDVRDARERTIIEHQSQGRESVPPLEFNLELDESDIQEFLTDLDFIGNWVGPEVKGPGWRITSYWSPESGVAFYVDGDRGNGIPAFEASSIAATLPWFAELATTEGDVTVSATDEAPADTASQVGSSLAGPTSRVIKEAKPPVTMRDFFHLATDVDVDPVELLDLLASALGDRWWEHGLGEITFTSTDVPSGFTPLDEVAGTYMGKRMDGERWTVISEWSSRTNDFSIIFWTEDEGPMTAAESREFAGAMLEMSHYISAFQPAPAPEGNDVAGASEDGSGAASSSARSDENCPTEQTPSNFIIVDDAGLPIGTMDVNKIQDDGMNLALQLAAHSGDEDKTEQILAEQVETHGPRGVGYVLMIAIKNLTNDILAGAFDVMEAATGTKPRAKMAEIAGSVPPATNVRENETSAGVSND